MAGSINSCALNCLTVLLLRETLLNARKRRGESSKIPAEAAGESVQHNMPKHPTSLYSERGATMVETAIALPLLLLILIISVDLLRLSYYSLTLQYVLNRAVREAVVGPVNRPPAYATQEEWIQGASVRLARSLGLSISDADIAICPYSAIVSGTPCDPLADDAGQPGELIVVQAVSPRSGFGWTTTNALSTRGYTLAAQVVGRNERWEQ